VWGGREKKKRKEEAFYSVRGGKSQGSVTSPLTKKRGREGRKNRPGFQNHTQKKKKSDLFSYGRGPKGKKKGGEKKRGGGISGHFAIKRSHT